MSEWNPIVVKLDVIEKHPQADTLEMSTILGGYVVVFKESRFKEGDLAAYIPSDTICSDNPEFDWLGDKKRIKPVKIRGIFSLGILASPPPNSQEGSSVVDFYGLKKYEYDEEAPDKFSDNEAPPNVIVPYYDLDALRRYQYLLDDGEDVVISEKIEGANALFFHDGNRLWVKSRNWFKKQDPSNIWWDAAIRYDLVNKLNRYPNKMFFAELYGNVKGFSYDCELKNNKLQTKLRFFDMYDCQNMLFANWSALEEAIKDLELETAPVIFKGEWSKDLMYLAEGKSLIGENIREGFVVRPSFEKIHPHQGRVILKHKGETYLLKKK